MLVLPIRSGGRMNISDDFSKEWQQCLSHSPLSDSASLVLSGSDYVLQWGQRHPDHAEQLIQSNAISRHYHTGDYRRYLVEMLDNVVDENTLQQYLRYFRQREMVRIIWRDLADMADLEETMQDLSALADTCIEQTLSLLYQWQTKELGTPCNSNGKAQQLVVVGMGKLGAGELNLSSDIDLIFAYPEDGDTRGSDRTVSNQIFFARLGQKLIQALDNITSDGFVFRVDMRLRPFGDSGALALSFAAMEDYYQTQGREWERYAMIKARIITGVPASKKELADLLRSFAYRRYLDYGMFDALREMKSKIVAQLYRKGMESDIKLGTGGIREIEFIGQVFQLVYGGKDTSLQQRRILNVLDQLAEKGILPEYVIAELKHAYVFLRRIEHRVQAWADKQTHLLPEDNKGQKRLAILMGFANWQDFLVVLSKYRDQVQAHFENILTVTQTEESLTNFSLFSGDVGEKMAYLEQLGFARLKASVDELESLLDCHNFRYLSHTGQQRLEKLLPLLIGAAAGVGDPDTCLLRLCQLIESIMHRTAYMALLIENPLALSQLVKLCAASPMISRYLACHPVLLDELLNPHQLYEISNCSHQKDQLVASLIAVNKDDLERHMEILREFKQVTTLHVAAADITGVLPVMEVGDQLSELAEVQLEQVMSLAWRYLVERHGCPPYTQNEDLSQSGFSVVAYGKLGGMELGYGSDLDVVFIFNDGKQGQTDGNKPLDVLSFYVRLAQRMIHLLNTLTENGILYQVDTRLRPNGSSGLLVTSVSAFADYQYNDAWTWEHQALVRARCIAGDTNLARQISDIRRQVLASKRDEQSLASEVVAMRAKMREKLDKSTQQLFDLKQGVGGIADIEFMVQYAVLAWSGAFPELLKYTDNIRLLSALKSTGKLNKQDGDMLADAYRFYRDQANHCILQETSTVIAIEKVAIYWPQVKAVWQRWLG